MWTLSGLRVRIVWAIKLRKDGYVYGGSGHKNLSTQTKEGEGYLPAEDGCRGAPFIDQVGQPGPTSLGWFAPWLGFFSQHDHFPSVTFLLVCSTSCTAQTLSSTPFLALLVLPLDASCFESCLCSLAPLASHVTMNFLQSIACCPPMPILCMWSWWKLLGGHPMMYYGACMINLTRLPPSKHILWLSN
jgi:hypothetical protein